MVHVKSMLQQEMLVVIVDFNDVLKWGCLLKVDLIIYLSFKNLKNDLGSRIGRQSNLFKHHMRKLRFRIDNKNFILFRYDASKKWSNSKYNNASFSKTKKNN